MNEPGNNMIYQASESGCIAYNKNTGVLLYNVNNQNIFLSNKLDPHLDVVLLNDGSLVFIKGEHLVRYILDKKVFKPIKYDSIFSATDKLAYDAAGKNSVFLIRESQKTVFLIKFINNEVKEFPIKYLNKPFIKTTRKYILSYDNISAILYDRNEMLYSFPTWEFDMKGQPKEMELYIDENFFYLYDKLSKVLISHNIDNYQEGITKNKNIEKIFPSHKMLTFCLSKPKGFVFNSYGKLFEKASTLSHICINSTSIYQFMTDSSVNISSTNQKEKTLKVGPKYDVNKIKSVVGEFTTEVIENSPDIEESIQYLKAIHENLLEVASTSVDSMYIRCVSLFNSGKKIESLILASSISNDSILKNFILGENRIENNAYEIIPTMTPRDIANFIDAISYLLPGDVPHITPPLASIILSIPEDFWENEDLRRAGGHLFAFAVEAYKKTLPNSPEIQKLRLLVHTGVSLMAGWENPI